VTARGALRDRFEGRYIPEPNSGCWLWTGALSVDGYGRIRVGPEAGSKKVGAHRVSYELHKGPIPDGMLVCHKCDVPACVNPDHLWLGTCADNLRDRDAKGRGPVGDRNGSRTKPWARACQVGSRNGYAKLDDDGVRQIRAALASGERGCDIARRFSVSRPLVTLIKQRKIWSHL
jgi:hypothetical protein